jgi:predicted Zn finger-like uncharacterized protein
VFTQCSKCETVFRLSADALRAAGGQVRCGRCGEVFNALSRLAEDATGFTTGESPLFLETRADEILESSSSDLSDPPPEPPVDGGAAEAGGLPPGVDEAQLQFIGAADPELAAETSLEFTLPPGELDRIFIEPRSIPLHQLNADTQRAVRADVTPLFPAPPGSAPPPQAPLSDRVAGLEVSEDVRQEMLSSLRIDVEPAPRRPRVPFAAWLTAAIALGVLLAIQIVRPLLGGAQSASAQLSVYQLRQWGVTGDPGAKGTLRVRASILNTAPQLQPYPLLRVSLVNRFGTRVGAREFEPAEYLGHGVARMLAPGERVDAMLDILDPGKDAEGFEIDVCLRSADQSISCAGDAAAQAR